MCVYVYAFTVGNVCMAWVGSCFTSSGIVKVIAETSWIWKTNRFFYKYICC